MFEIGIITKAQGIRGEVRVLPTTDDPSRFRLLVGKEVLLRRENQSVAERLPIETQKIAITSVRLQKNVIVIKFDGIDTRNAAEESVGTVICVDDAQALPLGEDEFYIRDLIGLRVETEEGEFLGEISRVFPTGANDVYVISGETEFMLPAVKDFVKKVSPTEGKIIVRLVEGLRELTL
ncbi:MAG: ribosome maturation factor RimM [Defluviitaleaceae bacterium]|nr:ribosome maturation factor RimM [Defluviitaleaceae bacterium]